MILMAYGSPDRLADVPAYYADIRGGRPIAPEHLDDLVARYRGLGIDDSDAPSPLNAITEETRAALERELGLPVLTGMRHWDPRIAAAVHTALELGHETLVGLVLAPHWSTLSVARYEQLFLEAVAGRVETRFVRRWGAEPGFVDLLAPWEVVEREALVVLSRAGGRAGLVFNLGHGVLPETDPDVVTRLAHLVGERTEAGVAA